MDNMGLMNILVVDDEPAIRILAQKEFARPNRKISTASTISEAMKMILQFSFDVIVLDVRLPDGTGLELLEFFRENLQDVEVIMVTGYSEVSNAVEAMKMGAYDYITKPFSLDRVNLVIERAFQRVLLQREIRFLRENESNRSPRQITGSSAAMKEIKYLADKVAPTDTPVLITGESGVGKNVVVNVIHGRSNRADRSLIVKNCGSFNKELLRSELFGYRKGAFTGAVDSHEGLLSQANKGTLFFDEVGELSLEVQSMLLRVLETQKFRRVGEKEEHTVNIRFLFATNRDLDNEVKEGRFHEALYHRLNVFRINIPPLRERKEDIPALMEHFLEHLYPERPPYRIAPHAAQCLLGYDWPGNIRELRNVIERGTILAENDLITTKNLPLDIAKCLDVPEKCTPFPTIQQNEKELILRVFNYTDQNRTKTSKLLGIGRKTLYRKLQSYGIE